MAPSFTDILSFAVWLCWDCLSLTPDNFKNGFFALTLPTQRFVVQILLSSDFAFAPGLLEVLQPKTPPTITFFKSLPYHTVKSWAIYVFVLEKKDFRPQIYIGSGTESMRGASARFHQYNGGHRFSKFVKRSLRNEYKITYTGLLCWTPLPSAVARIPLRAVFWLLRLPSPSTCGR